MKFDFSMILKITLIVFLFGGLNLHSNAAVAYNSDRLKQDGNTLYVYPRDNSPFGFFIGGGFVAVGLVLAAWDFIQARNIENNRDYDKDGKIKDERNRHKKKIGFGWAKDKAIGGGIFCLTGAVFLGLALFLQKQNSKPFISLHDYGISSGGKSIKWGDLVDIVSTHKTKTVRSTNQSYMYTPSGTYTINTPTTKTVLEKYLGLVSRKSRSQRVFSCEKGSKDIYISVKELPISEKEFIELVKDFRGVK